jgi:hypothetical protein
MARNQKNNPMKQPRGAKSMQMKQNPDQNSRPQIIQSKESPKKKIKNEDML